LVVENELAGRVISSLKKFNVSTSQEPRRRVVEWGLGECMVMSESETRRDKKKTERAVEAPLLEVKAYRMDFFFFTTTFMTGSTAK